MNMKNIKIIIRKKLIKLHIYLTTLILIIKFPHQKKYFNIIKKNILNIDFNLRINELKYIDNYWIDIHKKIILDNPRNHFYFFNIPALIETMSGGHYFYNYQPLIKFCENYLNSDEIKILLKENPIGGPRILFNSFNTKYGITSLNKVVHLYQLSLIEIIYSKLSVNNFNIVEWGGGFGGLAYLAFIKYKNLTFTIIDIPASIMTQYLYLATLLGESNVNLVENGLIETGKINLVRLDYFDKIKYDSDVFISSWAISESNNYSQEMVKSNNFFNSKYGILIHQKASDRHKFAESLNSFLLTNKKILIQEEIPVFKDQYLIIWNN